MNNVDYLVTTESEYMSFSRNKKIDKWIHGEISSWTLRYHIFNEKRIWLE